MNTSGALTRSTKLLKNKSVFIYPLKYILYFIYYPIIYITIKLNYVLFISQKIFK